MDRDDLLATPATATPAPEMISTPTEANCPYQAKTTALRVILSRASDMLPGSAG